MMGRTTACTDGQGQPMSEAARTHSAHDDGVTRHDTQPVRPLPASLR